jgi:hypothetical protein
MIHGANLPNFNPFYNGILRGGLLGEKHPGFASY